LLITERIGGDQHFSRDEDDIATNAYDQHVMAAKADNVDLSHSGRKIARKREQSKWNWLPRTARSGYEKG
jgi:hypothetical protein